MTEPCDYELIAVPYELTAIVNAIVDEVERQHEIWGEQNHPDGRDAIVEIFKRRAAVTKAINDAHVQNGTLTWFDILTEEIEEAFAETGTEPAHTDELIQAAAVIVTWLVAKKRRA